MMWWADPTLTSIILIMFTFGIWSAITWWNRAGKP
jgi:hypothetical protein